MEQIGILLIHGFAGGRHEVVSLRNYFEEKGYLVKSPVLAGHEATRKEMKKAKYEQWVESAFKEYAELAERCERVAVIGFSMGGLIAAFLYDKRPYDLLINVNTPIDYWDWPSIFQFFKRDFSGALKKYFRVCTDKPIASLKEFLKIRKNGKPYFQKISCPCLFIQTLDDDTVKHTGPEYMAKQVKGKAEVLFYPRGGHQVFETEYSEPIRKDIWEFIKRNLIGT